MLWVFFISGFIYIHLWNVLILGVKKKTIDFLIYKVYCIVNKISVAKTDAS